MNQDFESSNFTEIHNYIHLAFTEPGSNKYSLTSAIAEVHLRSDEISGIRYPAITKNSDVDNIALKPEFVLTSVILESAQLIKVEDISKDTNVISGEIIADLVGRSDGNLKWHFRGQDIPVYPGEAFPLGVGIHIIRSPADVRIENKFYHLEAGYAIEIPPVGDVIVRNIKGEIIKPRSIN